MSDTLTIFLCGDVMPGRGLDQILPFPSDPILHEDYIKDAKDYISLAEKINGPIPRSVDPAYIWGESLIEFEKIKPDAKIINLETSITTSENWQDKGINYRMHPKNISCLNAAAIDCCVLANNHVLDWGARGLKETLKTLSNAGIKTAGAGLSLQESRMPALLSTDKGCRIIVFSFGLRTSGIPEEWAANEQRPGIDYLENLSAHTVKKIKARIKKIKKHDDIVVASIHWGKNWGYDIPDDQRTFARKLIAEAGVDIVHGHSSHHMKAIEVYNEKLILYGCGDFITDYEGLRAYENYRGDLSLMYFADVEIATGKLRKLRIIPMKLKKFSLEKAGQQDTDWLLKCLNHEGLRFGTEFFKKNNSLMLKQLDSHSFPPNPRSAADADL